MTAKDIEAILLASSGGATLLTVKEIAQALRYKQPDSARTLLRGLEGIGNERTKRYLASDVAAHLYRNRTVI